MVEPTAGVAEAINGEGLPRFLYMGQYLFFFMHAASRKR